MIGRSRSRREVARKGIARGGESVEEYERWDVGTYIYAPDASAVIVRAARYNKARKVYPCVSW